MKEGSPLGLIKQLFTKPMYPIYAPVAGSTVPLQQVPDPTFSQEILGKGVAIEPIEGKVYAPCDATVDMAFTTGHAISLTADFGAELLIHVGTETAGLNGRYFKIHVVNGDKVSRGDLLIEFDLEAVKAEGYSVITPILVCNSGSYGAIKTSVNKAVTNENVVIELAK